LHFRHLHKGPEAKAALNADTAGYILSAEAQGRCGARTSQSSVIRRVLDTEEYRARASLISQEFARIDTRAEILRIVADSTRSADGRRLLELAR
jgi:hypothetical protein